MRRPLGFPSRRWFSVGCVSGVGDGARCAAGGAADARGDEAKVADGGDAGAALSGGGGGVGWVPGGGEVRVQCNRTVHKVCGGIAGCCCNQAACRMHRVPWPVGTTGCRLGGPCGQSCKSTEWVAPSVVSELKPEQGSEDTRHALDP